MRKAYDEAEITQEAKLLFQEERSKKRLDGWFIARERAAVEEQKYLHESAEKRAAHLLKAMARAIPLAISEHAIFAGSQDDAFARSYALINPAFKMEEFSGYCDPTAVFDDIEPNEEFTPERIRRLRDINKRSAYVKDLTAVYDQANRETKEVLYYFEQVTGHLVPDFRAVLRSGITALKAQLTQKIKTEQDEKKIDTLQAMDISLDAVLIIASRYQALAREQMTGARDRRKVDLQRLIDTLERVPESGATGLYEAIQSFMLLWQVMCLEQTPNPYAFSVGNADRIFEPYRAMEDLSRGQAAALFKHFLVFFNVADRSWAISQDLIVSGKNDRGEDLTNETSYALLDAYFDMNLPQPILSAKLHAGTPRKLYEEMGRFFFSPGVLTPSIFNDDSLFEILRHNGVADDDLADYSIAGCQEPLIMGKDNGNTTNSWLNLAKVLEVTLTGGISLISGEKLGDFPKAELKNIKTEFYQNLAVVAKYMETSANGASRALSHQRIPFLSTFMGGLETGIDTRDPEAQGTKYNGSGCLVHGLAVLADSFVAIRHLLKERPEWAGDLVDALRNNFVGYDELFEFLHHCPKFGNHVAEADGEAREIVDRVAELVRSLKNYLGNPFRPDFSTPSTHLLYGYWVGATPDGRKSREMLGYGVDPLYGEAGGGMGFRMLSNMELPFEQMNGGYASHFGVDPKYFHGKTLADKGREFADRIIRPLFFNEENQRRDPFYLYVNVTTPDTLRKLLENPQKYAPSGVYIVRIHGTFVNFLDLSPDIQQDIIRRLDLPSTAL